MPRSFKSILFLFMILGIFGFIGKTAWDMHLQYQGVCLEKGRALTDEEKIRAVIAEMNKSKARSVKWVTYQRVPYTSVDAFLEENPDCCSVELINTYGSEPYVHTRDLDQALGAYAGHVTVNYTLHYLDENGVEQKVPDKLIYEIQNCGVVD